MEYELGQANDIGHILIRHEKELEDLFGKIADILSTKDCPVNRLSCSLDRSLLVVSWTRP